MSGNGKLKVTRAYIADEIHDVLPHLSSKEASRVVDSILRGIRSSLTKGEPVKISGFGKWTLRDKQPRNGRNPQTGEPLTIAARRVLKFRASNVFRYELNTDPFDTKEQLDAEGEQGSGG